MRIALFVFLCLCSTMVSAQRALTTITVSYSSPQQLLAVIKPYLSPGSTVSAYQNQLILNVTPQELAKTQELLKTLDKAGRQLLISVRTDGNGSDSERGVDINTVIRSGNTVITNGAEGRPGESRTTVRVQNQRGTSADNGNQSVRATEGMPAYIGTGMTAAVPGYSVSADGRRYYQQDYVNAVAGFYATTWINDGTVRISIDQSNDRLQGQTIATQQLRTEVSGALGQWLPIGVINDQAKQQDSNLGSAMQSSRSHSTQLYLKVDVID
ncbi:MAG: hypothetical protein R3E64_04420 [Halioglobus sp.]